jgi:hypothetical protein
MIIDAKRFHGVRSAFEYGCAGAVFTECFSSWCRAHALAATLWRVGLA